MPDLIFLIPLRAFRGEKREERIPAIFYIFGTAHVVKTYTVPQVGTLFFLHGLWRTPGPFGNDGAQFLGKAA